MSWLSSILTFAIRSLPSDFLNGLWYIIQGFVTLFKDQSLACVLYVHFIFLNWPVGTWYVSSFNRWVVASKHSFNCEMSSLNCEMSASQLHSLLVHSTTYFLWLSSSFSGPEFVLSLALLQFSCWLMFKLCYTVS